MKWIRIVMYIVTRRFQRQEFFMTVVAVNYIRWGWKWFVFLRCFCQENNFVDATISSFFAKGGILGVSTWWWLGLVRWLFELWAELRGRTVRADNKNSIRCHSYRTRMYSNRARVGTYGISGISHGPKMARVCRCVATRVLRRDPRCQI